MTGHITYRSCPSRNISQGIANLIYDAELLDKGIPPTSGGTLEQDAHFMSMARRYLNYRAEMENQKDV